MTTLGESRSLLVQQRSPTSEELARAYLEAKRAVLDAGFAIEIQWQRSRNPRRVTEVTFLREAAWVILSAGMREGVVRGLFPQLTEEFHDWQPSAIVADAHARNRGLAIFRHERKIDAIVEVARVALDLGTDGILALLKQNPFEFFSSLPYIGPVTERHLAKNLGLQVAKPDRHLVRFAKATNRSTVDALCCEISDQTNDPASIVDIVLWRWATIHTQVCKDSRCCGILHRGLSDTVG